MQQTPELCSSSPWCVCFCSDFFLDFTTCTARYVGTLILILFIYFSFIGRCFFFFPCESEMQLTVGLEACVLDGWPSRTATLVLHPREKPATSNKASLERELSKRGHSSTLPSDFRKKKRKVKFLCVLQGGHVTGTWGAQDPGSFPKGWAYSRNHSTHRIKHRLVSPSP